MDQETRNEIDQLAAAQLRTNQSLNQLTEITVNLATTTNGLAETVNGLTNTVNTFVEEQREANKSLKAGQDQLSAIVNKLLDDQG